MIYSDSSLIEAGYGLGLLVDKFLILLRFIEIRTFWIVISEIPPFQGPWLQELLLPMPTPHQWNRSSAQPSLMLSGLKVLLVGCGGIGGSVAARLAPTAATLTLLSSNEEISAQWVEKTVSFNGQALKHWVEPSQIFTSAAQLQGTFDLVLIAVPTPQLESLATDLRHVLRPDSRLICLSNGLGEAHLAKVLGIQQVYGAVVSWGARMPAPGQYVQTSKGRFILGAYRPGQAVADDEPQLKLAQELLAQIAPVTLTNNLAGARFSKLAINCAISTLGTIGGTTLGKLLRRRQARRIGLQMMSEAVAVAQAESIALEPVARLDLERLFRMGGKGQGTKRLSQHAILLAVGTKYRRLRSSSLAAMERGRAPSVDFLNGEIVELGQVHGICTPYNQAAVSVVWKIASGELQSGPGALKELENLAKASGPSRSPELVASL